MFKLTSKRKKNFLKVGTNQLNRSAAFTFEVEQRLISGIDKTLAFYDAQYRKLPKGSNARLSIMMRTLDLNLEQAAYTRNQEEVRYASRWESWDAGGRKGPEPKVDSKRSDGYWRKVINQADRIMKEYPKNGEADRVIFTRAFAFSYLGRQQEAAKLYSQLVERYPNSDVSGDALTALGDFYFDRNDFNNAATHYNRSLKYKRAKRYLWAVFKLGWCAYNVGRMQESLRYWKRVVSESNQHGNTGARLKDEAMRDMVFAFAELRDIQGAIAYYRANGGETHLRPLILMLARRLADQGDFAEAIRTYKMFQQMFPTDLDAPVAQKEIVLLAFELQRVKDLWGEVERLIGMYGRDNGSWAQANKGKRKEVLETQKMVRTQAIYYPKVLHKRAQTTGTNHLHQHAKMGYQVYLKNFPSSRETVEVKFNLADIEFFLKNFRDSGRHYLEISLLGPEKAVIFDANSGKPTNIHRESSVYMVDAYARDFEPEFKKMQKTKPDFSKPPRKLTIQANNYIRACSTYVRFYPKDEKTVTTCELDVAKIFYLSGDKPKSRQYLLLVATKYPKTKDGEAAVENLIPLYADDQVKLLAIAEQLLKIPEYQKGRIGQNLRNLRQSAAKEAMAKEKDPLKRAQGFEELVKKNPTDPEADKMLYMASDNYLQAGRVASAIATYAALIERYPKSSQAPTAMLDLAQIYEKTLEFETSTRYLLMFVAANSKDKRALGASAKACDLMIALDSSQSLRVCQEFIKLDPAQAKSVYYRLMINAERAKRRADLTQIVQNFYLRLNLSPQERVIALAKLGGRDREILQQKGSMSGEALRIVAEIPMRDIPKDIAQYMQMGLVGGDINRLQKSIEAKGAALLRVKTKLDAVLKTTDSYHSSAAFYYLGLIHKDYADKLSSPPAIQGASTEDVAKQLAPQVQALLKEALEFYRRGYDLLQKFKAYHPLASKNYDGMMEITKRPMRFEDLIGRDEFYGTMMSSSLADSILRSR
jgi:TolA-binding protein